MSQHASHQQLTAPGTGYSFDTGQIVTFKCYDTTTSTSKITGQMRISGALSYSEFQRELGKHTKASAAWKKFLPKGLASYMGVVQDKSYSFSLNYYHMAQSDVAVQLKGFGKSVLTEFGLGAYEDGKNPEFGLICGDHFISSYQVGAMLLMSIVVEFKSHSDKPTFEFEASSGWGDIINVAHKIKKIAQSLHTSGSVSIYAEQVGGDPIQLGGMLGRDSQHHYHITRCSLEDMDRCANAAGGLLDYARVSFPSQISFETNKGLVSLGEEFVTYTPINRIGLKIPKSFVTPEILAEREWLTAILEENQYYKERFHKLLHGYPVSWERQSAMYLALESLNRRVVTNLAVLQDSDPYKGAIGCFDLPDRCMEIAATIRSQLVPMTADDLAVLEPLRYWYEQTMRDSDGWPKHVTQSFYWNGLGYGAICIDARTCHGAIPADFPKVLQGSEGVNYEPADDGKTYNYAWGIVVGSDYTGLHRRVTTITIVRLDSPFLVEVYKAHPALKASLVTPKSTDHDYFQGEPAPELQLVGECAHDSSDAKESLE